MNALLQQAILIKLAAPLMAFLRLIFHRTQRAHDVDGFRHTCDFLDRGVQDAHKDVVLLINPKQSAFSSPFVHLLFALIGVKSEVKGRWKGGEWGVK